MVVAACRLGGDLEAQAAGVAQAEAWCAANGGVPHCVLHGGPLDKRGVATAFQTLLQLGLGGGVPTAPLPRGSRRGLAPVEGAKLGAAASVPRLELPALMQVTRRLAL